ncbi:MAG: hypothetical protein ACHQUC_06075 [Chlamydiales bacterium]
MVTFRKSVKVVDAVLNSLPFVSILTNGLKLLYKLVHKVDTAAHFIGKGRLDDIKIHIINRSLLECLWGMVPLISNLTNILYHLFVKRSLPRQLSEAVKTGNLEVVKLYLTNHPLNQTPDKAKKILKIAAKESTLEVFNEILNSYEWRAEDLLSTLDNFGFPNTQLNESQRATINSLLDNCQANQLKFREEFIKRESCFISYSQSFSAMGEQKMADKILHMIQEIKTHDHQIKAAITIQKYFRGYLIRKSLLPRSLYRRYSALCRNRNLLKLSIPRSPYGKIPVLLPREIPEVVLKVCNFLPMINPRTGQPINLTSARFHQMEKVRAILRSQKSSHLVIPKATVCNNILVEERLPIKDNDFYHMGLYGSEPHLFNEAIQELAKLFAVAPIEDLIKVDHNYPFNDLYGDVVRWDNLPLYVVEEKGERKGKIGLIDLGQCYIGSSEAALDNLCVLFRIFPYHFDLIWESFFQAANLNLTPSEQQALLKAKDELRSDIVSKAKEYYEKGCTNHLNWLKSKGVAFDSDHRFAVSPVSPARQEKLASEVQKMVPSMNQGEALKVVESILAHLSHNINVVQVERMKSIRGVIQSYPEMIELRSIFCPMGNLGGGEVIELLCDHLPQKNKIAGVADQIGHAILEELVNGGEIHFFQRNSGTFWIQF